jgi:hypothetical protein
MLALALMVCSPTALGPCEQYPPAHLLTLGSALALLCFSRLGTRLLGLGALVLCLLATGLHLSVWFVLVPLLLGLQLVRAERRVPLASILLALLLLFWGSAQPWLFERGLMGVLDGALNTQPDLLLARATLDDLHFVRTNPLLYLVPLLFFVPRLRRRAPEGPLLACVLWGFVLVHWGLALIGAIHGWAKTGHHYFDLTEGLAIVASVLALRALGGTTPLRRRVVFVAAGLLLLSQLLHGGWLVHQMFHGGGPS